MPTDIGDIEGDLEVYGGYKSTSMRRADVYRTASQGGGGYGDPLDRDVHRVADDVVNGLVSTEWARRVYGVVFDPENRVDVAATEKARAAIRDERRRACGQTSADIPPAPKSKPSPQSIQIAEAIYCEPVDGKLKLRCRCGHVLGLADRSPKSYALMARMPVQMIGPEVNPHSINGARFELREFYCPSCMTRLEVEIARPDDAVLEDARVSTAWLEKQMTSRARKKQTIKGGS
jgi:N-methylhydantoinase B